MAQGAVAPIKCTCLRLGAFFQHDQEISLPLLFGSLL
jgi:hypothetical protein